VTHANGTMAQHDYDAGGRLNALRNLKSDASVISIFTYTYDSIGNRLGVVEANGDRVTWSYDEAYQLTREQRSGSNAYDITYTYDGLGNRLNKIEGGATTTYAYDAANELLTTEDASGLTTFTYDANGNTIGEVRPNADRVTYTWDVENHLTKVELPSAVVNTITLDGDGKRRRIEDSAGLRNIVWDSENILVETDSNNATAAAYTMEPEVYGNLVSQRRSGASSFHHFDALGSTNKLTDGSAATLIEYLYRAFGQQTVLSGSSANPFTWVGQLGYYRQADANDYWVRQRMMKDLGGRWLSRDSQSSGLPLFGVSRHARIANPYSYVQNGPLTSVDPSGLFLIILPIIGKGKKKSRDECRKYLDRNKTHIPEILRPRTSPPVGHCAAAVKNLADFVLGGCLRFADLAQEFGDQGGKIAGICSRAFAGVVGRIVIEAIKEAASGGEMIILPMPNIFPLIERFHPEGTRCEDLTA